MHAGIKQDFLTFIVQIKIYSRIKNLKCCYIITLNQIYKKITHKGSLYKNFKVDKDK